MLKGLRRWWNALMLAALVSARAAAQEPYPSSNVQVVSGNAQAEDAEGLQSAADEDLPYAWKSSLLAAAPYDLRMAATYLGNPELQRACKGADAVAFVTAASNFTRRDIQTREGIPQSQVTFAVDRMVYGRAVRTVDVIWVGGVKWTREGRNIITMASSPFPVAGTRMVLAWKEGPAKSEGLVVSSARLDFDPATLPATNLLTEAFRELCNVRGNERELQQID